MRTLFAVFTLALLFPVGAATLSHPQVKEAGSGIYDQSETNAQLIVSVAGLSLLPETSEGDGESATHSGAGNEQVARKSADAAQLHAILRSLQRRAADGGFFADTSDLMESDSATGNAAAGDVLSGEDSQAAIRELQQSGVVAVPEPSTYALLGAGAMLLAFKARRR